MALTPGTQAKSIDVFGTLATSVNAAYSLTTIANQQVIVWVTGYANVSFVSGSATPTVLYNGVSKNSVNISTPAGNLATGAIPFALMFTMTPGAATNNITVTGATDYTIMVLKSGT